MPLTPQEEIQMEMLGFKQQGLEPNESIARQNAYINQQPIEQQRVELWKANKPSFLKKVFTLGMAGPRPMSPEQQAKYPYIKNVGPTWTQFHTDFPVPEEWGKAAQYFGSEDALAMLGLKTAGFKAKGIKRVGQLLTGGYARKLTDRASHQLHRAEAITLERKMHPVGSAQWGRTAPALKARRKLVGLAEDEHSNVFKARAAAGTTAIAGTAAAAHALKSKKK